jgi:opacity protein-like surface antigen
MKRALFGVAVAFCLGLAGFSDVQAQGITLGAQGGYNYAQLSDIPTDVSEVGDKGSFVVGAFVDIQFHPLLFIGVEGNYLENKSDITDADGTSNFKQAYVQIPAYLGARLLSGMFQPVLYAGASVSFETTCDLTLGTLTGSCSDAELDTKSSIWSAVFGGGLDVSLGSIVLNGDIRYNLGLSKVAPDEDTKWNTWMAMVGVGFKLGV